MKMFCNEKNQKKKKSNSWKIKQHRDQFFKKSKKYWDIVQGQLLN